MDNIVIAHEVLHHIKVTNTKGILLKLDFEKTFDQVNWDFLFEILEGRGFGPKWIRCIRDIFVGSRTYVNFNGRMGEYFNCKRGLDKEILCLSFYLIRLLMFLTKF